MSKKKCFTSFRGREENPNKTVLSGCLSVSVVSSHRPAKWVSALLRARLSALCHISPEDTCSGYGERASMNRINVVESV